MSKDILIIEDEEDYRQSLIDLVFEGGNYTFHEAATVDEGINALRSFPEIKVVILDLHLVGEEGTDFLERIKEEASRYRVIVLTAHEELLPADVAEKYSVFNYLPKTVGDFRQSIKFTIDQSFKDLEREHLSKKVRKLLEIQAKINANDELEKTLQSICESVLDIVGGYTCHVRLLDARKGDYSLAAFAGPSATLSESMRRVFHEPKKAGKFFSGIVVESRKPERFDDLQHTDDFKAFKEKILGGKDISQEVHNYFDTVQSAYIIPIFTNVIGNVVDAIINISSESKSFFSEDRRALINEFVTQASLAITKDLLNNKRKELHQDYSKISKMLEEVTKGLGGFDGLGGIYRIVTNWISEIVNAELMSIFLFNTDTGLLENVAELRGDKQIEKPEEIYKPGESLAGKVYSSGEPKRLNLQKENNTEMAGIEEYDVDQDIYLKNIPHGRLEHYLGVPIKIGKDILGVLRAINKKSEYYSKENDKGDRSCLLGWGFSEDCENVLKITASYLAVAIRNSHLFNKLETLNSVGKIINSEMDLNKLLTLTIEETAQVMRAEICMLFLKDDTEDKIVLRECYGMPVIEGAFYDLGGGLTGRVALNRKSQLIKKTDENEGKYDGKILKFLRGKHGKDKSIESLMVVPIIAKDKILGALKVINKVGDHSQYDEEDLKFFETFASYVGIAIENAQVYDLTNQKLAIAERNSALSTLVRAVAHEINNSPGLIPVNVQGIKSEMARLYKELDIKGMQSFHNINANILEMLETIEDSARQNVDFANEIAGFRLGERKVADINKVIRKAVKQIGPDLQRCANSRNIAIEDRLAKEPLLCFVFKGPFIQIIRNIVINAYQAMEGCKKGILKIITSKDTHRGKVVIRLSDNGHGIRKKYINRIFDSDLTTKTNGNGLGLWLVKNHLEQIGGTITVESQVKHGATFIIEIPLAPEEDGHEQ